MTQSETGDSTIRVHGDLETLTSDPRAVVGVIDFAERLRRPSEVNVSEEQVNPPVTVFVPCKQTSDARKRDHAHKLTTSLPRRSAQELPEGWSTLRLSYDVDDILSAKAREKHDGEACRVVRLNRSTFYLKSTAKDQTPLLTRLRELAAARPRFGYPRLHILLRREGWHVNIKRVYRLYKLEGLEVRTKKRRKRASHLRVAPPAPTAANERWSMDFMRDTFDDGRPFRILTVVDTFTRECPLLAADRSITGKRVAELLDGIAAERGYPKSITVDNGTEFYSKAMDSWAYQGVQLQFIRPGKPVERVHRELQREAEGRAAEW